MTITMTSKNQITIPKKITAVLGLKKGALFNIELARNRIELIPLEIRKKVFTAQEYHQLESLSRRERGLEKRMTKEFMGHLKKGKG